MLGPVFLLVLHRAVARFLALAANLWCFLVANTAIEHFLLLAGSELVVMSAVTELSLESFKVLVNHARFGTLVVEFPNIWSQGNHCPVFFVHHLVIITEVWRELGPILFHESVVHQLHAKLNRWQSRFALLSIITNYAVLV